MQCGVCEFASMIDAQSKTQSKTRIAQDKKKQPARGRLFLGEPVRGGRTGSGDWCGD
jgi:hypothetical protein